MQIEKIKVDEIIPYAADITDDEKTFLIKATKRLYEFNYSKIAEYYAHASKEMQELICSLFVRQCGII